MVTRNMLLTFAKRYDLKINFNAGGPNKCLKQLKLLISLDKCAPNSELPPNIRSMK